MYRSDDEFRFIDIPNKPGVEAESFRSDARRDYARIIHSPAFRRLQGKTQLFPSDESDFFRNRLTHSLEVAQISKALAIRINSTFSEFKSNPINPDYCEIAGLIHDLGHPPFGHNGEKALDDCMKQHGGFEGNAQTLRIIMRLEKKECDSDTDIHGFTDGGEDQRVGLNLTARTILSALKYDNIIPESRSEDAQLCKGYYHSEAEDINTLKHKVCCDKHNPFKTIECSIMDIADDIAYSTYDIEDAFKAGFLTPYDILLADDDTLAYIAERLDEKYTKDQIRAELVNLFGSVFVEQIKTQKEIKKDKEFNARTLDRLINSYEQNQLLSKDGFFRTEFTSALVSKFMSGIQLTKYDQNCPAMSYVELNPETRLTVDCMKHLAFYTLINSTKLKVVEYRGYDVVKSIFKALSDTQKEGWRLLPEDFRQMFNKANSKTMKMRIICDFIAGMTDKYAIEFYSRISSTNKQTIFKPI
jgi:dGTPase